MTLILTAANSDQLIQVSDRRVTANGQLVDDEAGKAGVLSCIDARLAFGFTGLARHGRFDTWEWLLDALLDAGKEQSHAKRVLEQLTSAATAKFSKDGRLRHLDSATKRLSVLFSGYAYHVDPPLCIAAMLTNYQGPAGEGDSGEAWDEFVLTRWNERRPLDEEPTFIQRIGNWPSVSAGDVATIREMLANRVPTRGLVGKLVEIVREVANGPAAGGTIGKQLTAVVVPRDRSKGFLGSYHSEHVSDYIFMPDLVTIGPNGAGTAIRGFKVYNEGGAMVVPKVGRKQPCPCRSGLKYKHCHGRWR